MNCTSCGSNLPPGAAICPVCGVPTPYNVSGPGGGSPQYNSPGAAPPYGTPPPPSTGFGAPSYGTPVSQNPYDQGSSNPYGVADQNPYGVPPQQPYGAPPQPGTYAPPPAPKRRSRLGLILAIVAGVLILACIGVFVAVYQIGKSGIDAVNATATADARTAATAQAAATTAPTATPTQGLTPTTPATGASPSGASIDPTAASVITNPRLASAIDSNDYPTQFATTFAVKQNVYITYDIHPQGQGSYYLEAKWYLDNSFGAKKILTGDSSKTHGYFGETYNVAANGAVELYYCTKSDCSDEKLAQFKTFSVTATGSIQSTSPTLAAMDMHRKES